MPRSRYNLTSAAVLAAVLLWAAHGALAQFKLPTDFDSGIGGPGSASETVTVSAQFSAATEDRPAVLMVTADIAPGWHIYSLTQPKGGPQKTRIELAESDAFRQLGPFRPSTPYESHIDEVAWVGLELQEHHETVTWYAPIELAAGGSPDTLEIQGKVIGQVCKESCIPVNVEFTAAQGAGVEVGELAYFDPDPAGPGPGEATAADTFEVPHSAVSVSGSISPATAAQGAAATLTLTLSPPEGWHVYARDSQVPKVGPRPTLIAFDPASSFTIEPPTTTHEIVEVDQSEIGWDEAYIHHGAVTWTAEIRLPAEATPGAYTISGVIGYQACEDGPSGEGLCEPAKGVRFEVPLNVGGSSSTGSTPVSFAAAEYAEAAELLAGDAELVADREAAAAPALQGDGTPVDGGMAYDLEKLQLGESSSSLTHYIVLAFVGGIILNLMPCVLPVIGLKVMSFVEQAGKSRAHALALNLWYSAGIITVFLVLAALAISLGLSWGGQFGSTAFNVTLAALVFAMALSLLGVWEIPIPGFLGSGKTQSMAEQEGPAGAFLKGMITTVLATPCTGPFMATAIGWAVRQPPATTLTVFGSLGLGMASPYLLIGAFPGLIRFLPKPGNWMVTFKQVMGFVLLGTVVFLFSFMDPAAIVPSVALLLGVGIACWGVSRTPLTAAFRERVESWAMATAIVFIAVVVSFGWLYPQVMQPRLEARVSGAASAAHGGAQQGDEPWQPFSLGALQELVVQRERTVLVDFSAEWCITCKTLEKTVLHTDAVEQAIGDSEIVTMYADFTDYPEEIDRTLKALGSNGVPVIAIFPASDPYRPIVFRGAYTRDGLLAAIERATDTMSVGSPGTTAQISAVPAPGLN